MRAKQYDARGYSVLLVFLITKQNCNKTQLKENPIFTHMLKVPILPILLVTPRGA